MIRLKKTTSRLVLFLLCTVFISAFQLRANQSFAQSLSSLPKDSIYRATATKINDLVHTKLNVRFDYAKHFLYGQEWVTLKPHAYPTDSVSLDAKGMEIHKLSLMDGSTKHPLKYVYDAKQLKIRLPKTIQPNESYTLYIDYTAKPDQLPKGGSAAITDDKGLYFINTDKKIPNKPVQIWTQGETESSSCWFPTIDKPNQKTTEEISMTVPAEYVTLSNGRLDSQKKNADGTRTDTWKMELPHAPYLFMMAVGDFKIYKDHWRDKEVSYYLEPKYAPFAKQIFGNTPEIIDFYSKTLGVDYPWNKYSQIVVRDYVSGAMENTTATLHGESVQRTDKQLLDDNKEDYIAHELFHQWFGDYVTCESWSNLTVNESFAAFSEIMWFEYKYGKEKGDAMRLEKLSEYLQQYNSGVSPELVRFHYKSREDMFDAISYNKGAVILYMLRDLIGKDAFYKALHIYLTNNAFKSAEATQLRLAFEEATGQDLNWFWNQWYYKGGHPILHWTHSYDPSKQLLTVKIKQVQDASVQTYRLPLSLEFSTGSKTSRSQILISAREQEFTFKLSKNPDLVTLDPDHILVGRIESGNPNLASSFFQYKHGKNYIDREQAIDSAADHLNDPMAARLLLAAMSDKNPALRRMSIESATKETMLAGALPIIEKIATSDSNNLARSAAIMALAKTADTKYADLFKSGITSNSPAVSGACLNGLIAIDPKGSMELVEKMKDSDNPLVIRALGSLYAKDGLDEHAAFFEHLFDKQSEGGIAVVFQDYLSFLVASKNTEVVKRGIGLLSKQFRQAQWVKYKPILARSFEQMGKAKAGMASSASETRGKQALEEQSKAFQKASEELGKD